MAEVKINAGVRSGNTKGYKSVLRAQGRIPAVLYGKGISSEPIELEVKDLEAVLRKKGRNALINLVVKYKQKEKEYVVMVKEIQKDPLRGKIIHVDLCRVSLKDKLHTTVPVTLKGEARGLKNGGIIQTGPREIEIECMPTEIPEVIAIDISSLDIGDHLTVGDIPAPADYKILTELDTVLVTVVAPRPADLPEPTKAEAPGAGPAEAEGERPEKVKGEGKAEGE